MSCTDRLTKLPSGWNLPMLMAGNDPASNSSRAMSKGLAEVVATRARLFCAICRALCPSTVARSNFVNGVVAAYDARDVASTKQYSGSHVSGSLHENAIAVYAGAADAGEAYALSPAALPPRNRS